MVHQDVAAANRRPQVGRRLERRHRLRRQRPVLQTRQIHRRVELKEVGERDEAARLVEIGPVELELRDDRREDLRRQIHVVLQAHGRPHPAVAKTLLDGRQEVLVAAHRRRQVRVGVTRMA